MSLIKLWFIKTKNKYELEKTQNIVKTSNVWRSIIGSPIPFNQNNEDETFIVEKYCIDVYISYKAPEGDIPNSTKGTTNYVIPNWAIKEILAIDPEVDTEYFI